MVSSPRSKSGQQRQIRVCEESRSVEKRNWLSVQILSTIKLMVSSDKNSFLSHAMIAGRYYDCYDIDVEGSYR